MTIVMQGLSTKSNCILFCTWKTSIFLKGEHLLATMMKETWSPNYFANVSNCQLWMTTFGYYGEHVLYLSHKQCGVKCSKVNMKLQKECIISNEHFQNCQLQVTDLKKSFNIMNDIDKITF
jgi:hypothetical protein